jgi:hypothetical protein
VGDADQLSMDYQAIFDFATALGALSGQWSGSLVQIDYDDAVPESAAWTKAGATLDDFVNTVQTMAENCVQVTIQTDQNLASVLPDPGPRAGYGQRDRAF